MTARAAPFNARGLPIRNRNMYIYIYGFLLFLGKFFCLHLHPFLRNSASFSLVEMNLLMELNSFFFFSFIVGCLYSLFSSNNVNNVAELF